MSLSSETAMQEILASYPGAKRALFAHFHIGGCQSCAYADDETLASVCSRNELETEAVKNVILTSHQHDLKYLIEPEDLFHILNNHPESLLLIDIRTREENESVSIPGSTLLTQDLQQKLFASPPTESIVIYDHLGSNSLDTCSWFAGHGIKDCKALRGGIEAYAKEADNSIARYRLEIENS